MTNIDMIMTFMPIAALDVRMGYHKCHLGAAKIGEHLYLV